MFTGLVSDLGTVVSLTRAGESARLTIQTSYPTGAGAADGLAHGESIACDGVCLTVVESGGGKFSVDVSAETLDRSTLGDKKPGDRINLERALAAGDRMGGHIVQGHVDGRGTVRGVEPEGDYERFTIEAPEGLMPYCVEKGSIALDGVSLTINGVKGHELWIMLIPETLSATTLGTKNTGDRVNIEVDILAKYVERLLQTRFGADKGDASASSILRDVNKLREQGF